MPEQVLKEAERELDRLERTNEQQAEHGWIRTHLDWLCEGPANGRGSGAILTLVGPAGVGKTSLGESIARALGRKFTRVSLGGHRRRPRLLRPRGPVFMRDEIDKVGSDWRGGFSPLLRRAVHPGRFRE